MRRHACTAAPWGISTTWGSWKHNKWFFDAYALVLYSYSAWKVKHQRKGIHRGERKDACSIKVRISFSISTRCCCWAPKQPEVKVTLSTRSASGEPWCGATRGLLYIYIQELNCFWVALSSRCRSGKKRDKRVMLYIIYTLVQRAERKINNLFVPRIMQTWPACVHQYYVGNLLIAFCMRSTLSISNACYAFVNIRSMICWQTGVNVFLKRTQKTSKWNYALSTFLPLYPLSIRTTCIFFMSKNIQGTRYAWWLTGSTNLKRWSE